MWNSIQLKVPTVWYCIVLLYTGLQCNCAPVVIDPVSDLIPNLEDCSDIAWIYHLTGDDGTTKTPKGSRLSVVVLGINNQQHEFGRPEVRLTANIHGNELIGTKMTHVMIKYMCDIYRKNKNKDSPQLSGTEKDALYILKTMRLHILVTANPDGYNIFRDQYLRNRSSNLYLVGRNNAHNVDLNRNFPIDLTKMAKNQASILRRPPEIHSIIEPETKMLMAWMHSEPFVLALNFHGGQRVVVYPYDAGRVDGQNGSSLTSDHILAKSLARHYVDFWARHFGPLRPCPTKFVDDLKRFDNGIVNGADWYSFDGSMPDYSYLMTQCIELSIEGSCSKYPKIAKRFQITTLRHLTTTLNFLKAAHWGIKGRVTSEVGGFNVEIHIVHLNDSSSFLNRKVTRPNHDGEYYRLLANGRHGVVATLPGHKPVVRCVDVINSAGDQAQIVNFQLQCTTDKTPEFNDCSVNEIKAITYLIFA